ncbi:MAG: AAA family ATPase [Candidatus Delongbacteria bacterium]|nr:AAA family ATPase [Candidatus Delongbacteria bacterium]
MNIDSIRITGFRSIKGPLQLKLGQITAMIGANNVGKSNIVSAIYRVLGRDWVTVNTFDEDDVFNNDPEQDICIDIIFSEPFKHEVFKGLNIDIPKLRFLYTRYKVGENKGRRRLEKHCLKLNDEVVMKFKSRPQKGKQAEFEPYTTIPQEIQENIPVIYIGTDRSLKSQLPSSRNSLLGALLNEINKDFQRDENIMKCKDIKGNDIEITRKQRFLDCIAAAMEALKTDELLSLEKSIKTNALHQLGFNPETEADNLDIQFAPFTSLEFYKSLELFVVENNFRINATELGGGFQNALVIAIMKAFEERKKQGAIFLIEEPEMFLHPQMQRSLYTTIRNIGKTNQVIYITHSPHFVTIPEFDEIRIISKGKDGTQIVQSSLPADPKLKEKFRKELDPERNELFFARKLLIVEGDTEKLALPEYAKRLKADIDRNGGTIIEVGGKRNIIDFVELAISLQIPVGFIYDIDSSDFAKDQKEKEIEYNKLLDSYSKNGVAVWKLDSNYESMICAEFGKDAYQKYCNQYGGYSKAVRARMFAQDESIPVPKFINSIIDWITN